MAARSVFGGVDIGASIVKVGLVTQEGQLLTRLQQDIHPQKREPQDVVKLTSHLLHRVLHEAGMQMKDLKGVGVGCPGQLAPNGILHAAANFPSWLDVPLQQLLAESFGVKVHICNDADAAILAEQWVGSAKNGVKDFIMLTVGSGVGCGIVVDGKLVRGGTHTIEGGHLIVERNGRLCGCTQRGCLEAYSSAGALVLEAQEHVNAGANSKLSTYPQADINAKLIFDLANEGDQMCIGLISEAADYLGFACVNLARILDPEMIILSGGMAEAGEDYIQLVRAAHNKYSWTKFPNPVRIEKSTVGYDAGIIGAAAACRLDLP